MSVHDDAAIVEAFEAIVAAFGDQLRCAMATVSAGQCLRPARWRIDLHGCEQVNMCGQHKQGWVRRVLAQPGRPCCAHCGTEFDRVEVAVRITAI